MTRIVSGFARSVPLAVPARGTRPTSERAREAVFSALEAREELRDAHVLDLFAGSGALGLEAVSRGAAEVTLVDLSAQAVAACNRNKDTILKAYRAQPLGTRATVAPKITVVKSSAQSFLNKQLAAQTAASANAAAQIATEANSQKQPQAKSAASGDSVGFSLAFVDPPYAMAERELAGVLATLSRLMPPGSLVLLERAKRSGLPELSAGLVLERQKDYGDTATYWLAVK